MELTRRACSIDKWYDRFEGYTFPTKIIPLSDEFISYLKRDGIHLPKPPPALLPLAFRDPRYQAPTVADDDGSWDQDEEEQVEDVSFEEIELQIRSAIEDMGGEVIPKLNWTCPKDAEWMNGGSLVCGSAGEIFLLLKSSDFIQNDLAILKETALDPVLVLRKWKKQWKQSMEFRCFVRNSRLTHVCQRDASQYFEFLTNEEFQDGLLTRVESFSQRIILPRFTSSAGLFAFDVYVTPKRVWLVDFAHVVDGNDPHPLLSWEEFSSSSTEQDVDLRIVQDDKSRDLSEQRALAMHRVPLDVVEGLVKSDFFQGKQGDVM